MSDQERLKQLMRARHVCVFIPTHEEEYALTLVRDTALGLGRDLKLWSVTVGLRDGLVADVPPVPQTEHPAAALFHLAKEDQALMAVTLDLAGHLKDERTLRAFRDLVARFRKTGGRLFMIDHQSELPEVAAGDARRFEPSLPDEAELEAILRETVQNLRRESKFEVAFTKSALRTFVRNLRGLTRRHAEQVVIDAVTQDARFDAADINAALAHKRQAIQRGGLLEYVESPVTLDDIAGYKRLKAWLSQRREAATEQAAKFGLVAPRGILMLGVPGSGKSLCAKAVATAWQQPLLRLDAGALYDRYVGESERRLREALRQAEAMAPLVLWIDEIEKAFASAASRSSDGGLSQRMFGALLTWMQEHRAPVFIVATANDIEALPPELLRKGRFDEIFFVELPDPATREAIFAIHLKRRGRDPTKFDLPALAAAAEGYSGAEIEQGIVSALYTAFADKADLDTSRLAAALAGSPPLSVTMAEKVGALRGWAQGRCMTAD